MYNLNVSKVQSSSGSSRINISKRDLEFKTLIFKLYMNYLICAHETKVFNTSRPGKESILGKRFGRTEGKKTK